MSNQATRADSSMKLRAARELVAPILAPVRCPKERRAMGVMCAFPDCGHKTAAGSTLCGCCIDRAGAFTAARIRMLRKERMWKEVGELERHLLASLPPLCRRSLEATRWVRK